MRVDLRTRAGPPARGRLRTRPVAWGRAAVVRVYPAPRRDPRGRPIRAATRRVPSAIWLGHRPVSVVVAGTILVTLGPVGPVGLVACG